MIFVFRKTVRDFHRGVAGQNSCSMFSTSTKCLNWGSSRRITRAAKGKIWRWVDEPRGRRGKLNQVSEAQRKVSSAEWRRTRGEAPDGKLAECAPLPKRVCQEKEKSGIRRTEGDKEWFDLEPQELSEDEEEFGWTLWKWEASCKAGQRVCAPSVKWSALRAPKVGRMCSDSQITALLQNGVNSLWAPCENLPEPAAQCRCITQTYQAEEATVEINISLNAAGM